MPSRSKRRRESALEKCIYKRRYGTLLEAGIVARKLRSQARNPSEKKQVPYLCPNGSDHFHVGRNIIGFRAIKSIEVRIDRGELILKTDLEYCGLIEVKHYDTSLREVQEVFIER